MTFIHDDFLLDTPQARILFHDYAAQLPIIDYHCHLSPRQVAQNQQFKNLYHVWLAGDHYKWRAMRANGVDERYCTGDASDWEKFEKWSETVPYTLRNPLYHWTHLELRKPFGISDKLLNKSTAKYIWDTTNELLAQPEFYAQGLLAQAKVELICTTDDPIDDLSHHQNFSNNKNCSTTMLPTWRPDRAMAVENADSYNAYVDKLAQAAHIDIANFQDLLTALQKRHDFFHEQGCRLSDHGLETFYSLEYTQNEINAIFAKIRSGKNLQQEEIQKFQSALLVEFATQDHAKGWVQQFHIGAIRNNNTRLYNQLGADAGFDSIGDTNYAKPLAKFLNQLDQSNQLAKTILYNLNPRDNEMIGTMIGNFQDGSVAGKIQFGSGWWFLDQMDGITRQLDALSQMGLLSRFVGMLTDSRSFLSYSRHEYFRRILCGMLGRDMAKGLVPDDVQMIGQLISDISYHNAKQYFPFPLKNND